MSGAKVTALSGERLPPCLGELRDPPDSLYVHGELPRGPGVAIVGTRKPTEEGEAFARDLAGELASAGVTILSGGAVGIDAAAHEGALLVNGRTVVVAPAGYGAPFPAEHAGLFARVVESGGAYVALVPDDRPALPAAFFARNRCLAALAQIVIVVQAPLRSGARNAAKYARRLGRALMVVPSCPWIYEGQGCVAELRRGAEPCSGSGDVLKRLQALGAVMVPLPAREREGVSDRQESFDFDALPQAESDLARIVDSASRGITEADALGVELGLPAARIQRAILTLRLRGVLVPGPHGGLVLSKSSI
jgi:DNA processing protein